MNPAVTTAMAAIGKFKWSKVWYYLLAQYVGGILASAVVYLDHFEAIEHFDPSHQANITGEIFATYPARFVTIPGAFVDQVTFKFNFKPFSYLYLLLIIVMIFFLEIFY